MVEKFEVVDLANMKPRKQCTRDSGGQHASRAWSRCSPYRCDAQLMCRKNLARVIATYAALSNENTRQKEERGERVSENENENENENERKRERKEKREQRRNSIGP